jgi:hypothetical protein
MASAAAQHAESQEISGVIDHSVIVKAQRDERSGRGAPCWIARNDGAIRRAFA